MNRQEYNRCVAEALTGKKFTKEERKTEFCIAAKSCSGKASSRSEAEALCAISASKPKTSKSRRRRSSGGSSGGMRLILLTTTGCKPCSSAKNYLQDKIDRGDVEVLDVQKSDFAADLVAKNNIVSVPKLMLVDSQGIPFSEIQITDSEQML